MSTSGSSASASQVPYGRAMWFVVANRAAVSSLRDPTARTSASSTSARSLTKFAAMCPVATTPQRIRSVMRTSNQARADAAGHTGHPFRVAGYMAPGSAGVSGASDSAPRAVAGATSRLGAVDAFLIDAVRTPFGKHRGGLAGIRTDDLATLPIVELMRRHAGLDPARIDDVLLGDTNGAGEDNRNVARMAVLLAGLPDTVPGVTVNRLCGSGGEAVIQAARAVRSGDATVMIAGGVESMTRAPFVIPKPDVALPAAMQIHATQVGWRMINPKFTPQQTASLGACAEAVAAELGISRQAQDEWALRSHERAAAAFDKS